MILLLCIVTSLFCFVQTQAEENDAQTPIIIVKGETVININVGETYVDEGVIAYDFQQGFITEYVATEGSVNTSMPGNYTITYSVRDADNNYAPEMTRTVTVMGEVAITTKPIIRSHNVGKLEGASVEVSFEVDQNTQAVIGYGLDGKYTMFSSPERLFTYKNHIQTLTDIEAGKTYSYLIYVRNKEGKSSYVKGTFNTNGTGIETPDTFKVLSHRVDSITSNTAKIHFEATDYAQAYIEYGRTENYGIRTKGETSFKYIEHLQSLTNLEKGTQYYYRIHITNKDENTVSTDGSFSTTGENGADNLGERERFWKEKGYDIFWSNTPSQNDIGMKPEIYFKSNDWSKGHAVKYADYPENGTISISNAPDGSPSLKGVLQSGKYRLFSAVGNQFGPIGPEAPVIFSGKWYNECRGSINEKKGYIGFGHHWGSADNVNSYPAGSTNRDDSWSLRAPLSGGSKLYYIYGYIPDKPNVSGLVSMSLEKAACNKWTEIEMEVIQNSKSDIKDGVIRLYVDGKLVKELANIRTRTNMNVKPKGYGMFIGNTSLASGNEYHYWKDWKIYVGG